MNKLGDKIIIKQVNQGDVAAYAILVKRYQQMAYTLALSITKNKEDAEEVAQDAFVKAYKNLSTFKGKSKFSTWLYQIVYRTALSKIRIQKHHTQEIDDKVMNNDLLKENQPNNLEQLDRKLIIRVAIDQLKEDESFLLILYYYEELTVDEIADSTGLSESNVKVKLHRARKNMHDQLQTMLNGKAKTLIQL